MTCEDLRLLNPFRKSGDLLPDDAAWLDSHLKSCPACSALTAPNSVDRVIRKAFTDVPVPAGLKEKVGQAVAAERTNLAVRRLANYAMAASILAIITVLSFGIYGLTRPKLDTEGLAIRNGFETGSTEAEKLVYFWLDSEKLAADLPFEFDFRYYAGHGYEKLGRSYVPFVRFQNQNAPTSSFAKLYILRGTDVDARNASDAQSSFCTVRMIPGKNGISYALVHTGTNSAPFIRHATGNVD